MSNDKSKDKLQKEMSPVDGVKLAASFGEKRSVRVPRAQRAEDRRAKGPYWVHPKYMNTNEYHYIFVPNTPDDLHYYEDVLRYERNRDEFGKDIVATVRHPDYNQEFHMRLPLEEYNLRLIEDREYNEERQRGLKSKEEAHLDVVHNPKY